MKANLILTLLVIPFFAWSNADDEVFHQGNYLSAQKEASMSGKVQLLEFVAEWCMPCQHMDQTTFKDEGVKSLLKEKFVSVKVDIDQFDGFALKQKFEVRYLPTIILLDNNGKMIGKIEEALGPTALIEKLETMTSDITIIPDTDTLEEAVSSEYKAKTKADIKPHSPVKPELPEAIEAKPASQHFVLQFGVFGNVDNAKTLYGNITQVLPSEPEIKTLSVDGKTLYKVSYGPFEEMTEARLLKEEMERHGFKTLIKPLE